MGNMRTYLMIFLVGICITLMIFTFAINTVTKRTRFSIFSMSLSALIILVADKIVYYYNGIQGEKIYWLLRISKFLVYFLFLVVLYLFNQYLIEFFLNEGKLKVIPKRFKIIDYIIYSGITVLILSQFTGLYYTYDANNLYHRSKGYILTYMFPLVVLLIQLSVIIQFRKKIRKLLFLPLLLFTTMPLFAAVVQIIIHGAIAVSINIVAMVVLLFCFSILDTNKQLKLAHQKEIELLKEKEENANIMLLQTSMALAEAIDAKDSYTNGHSNRVAEYSVMIAKEVGKSKEECQEINLIALLHDVGKIGIPNSIINKNGKLTDEEFEIIKTHPVIGNGILSKISASPKLAIGAHYHHERYDGKGYPEGLKGEKIPEIARIIAVADSYDAMTSKRSYRDSMPQSIVRQEIEKGSGTQFDPQFAKIMLKLIDADKAYKLRQI